MQKSAFRRPPGLTIRAGSSILKVQKALATQRRVAAPSSCFVPWAGLAPCWPRPQQKIPCFCRRQRGFLLQLAPYRLVKRLTAQIGSRGRSIFFCVVSLHVNLPRDVEHRADSIDNKCQCCDDLGDCHVCSPPFARRFREVPLNQIEPPSGSFRSFHRIDDLRSR